MENKENKVSNNIINKVLKHKLIVIPIAVIVILLIIVLVIYLINDKGNNKSSGTGKYEVSATDVTTIVHLNLDIGNFYINDVGDVITVNSATLVETDNNIEIWEVSITYQLSSLSAPTGQHYTGSTTGTFYFAYNTENRTAVKYLEKNRSDLTRWINSDKQWISV